MRRNRKESDSDVIRINRTSEQDFKAYLGDVDITFGKLGINEITHPTVLENGLETHAITTDWVSPYIAGKVVNGTPSGDRAAVGGNHGTVGGSGFATANNLSTIISVDGETIGNSIDKIARKVVATVVNEITLKENINLTTGVRDSIDAIETVTYTLEKNHMAVHVDLKALTPLYIYWYMGLQSTNAYFNKAYFTYDIARPDIYEYDRTKLDSGTKGASPNMTRASMMNASDELMHVYTDKDYGIGYDYIPDDTVIAYLRENNLKFYYHLVKPGQNLMFDTNQSHSYRGGYIFSKKEGINAYVTRFVEDGVKKALVDFRLAATEQIKYSSIEDSQNVTGNGTSLTASTNNAYAKVVI